MSYPLFSCGRKEDGAAEIGFGRQVRKGNGKGKERENGKGEIDSVCM